MGDAESPVESNLYEDLSAEVLKVGHHGSTSSTSDSFLARVNPKAAIISVGADNDYGHPSNEVLTRLQSAGAKIYRTDEQGTITVTVTTDGGTYSINTEPSTSISASVIPVVKSTKYIGNKNQRSSTDQLVAHCLFHPTRLYLTPEKQPSQPVMWHVRSVIHKGGVEMVKSIGVVRKLDQLGRIVIPMEVRQAKDIKHDDPVEILTDDEKIVLRKYEPACIFCNNAEDLINYQGKKVCNNCINELRSKPGR